MIGSPPETKQYLFVTKLDRILHQSNRKFHVLVKNIQTVLLSCCFLLFGFLGNLQWTISRVSLNPSKYRACYPNQAGPKPCNAPWLETNEPYFPHFFKFPQGTTHIVGHVYSCLMKTSPLCEKYKNAQQFPTAVRLVAMENCSNKINNNDEWWKFA